VVNLASMVEFPFFEDSIPEVIPGATRLLPALIGRFASQFFALFRLQGSHAHLAAFLAALEPTFPAHLSHDLRNFILIHINMSYMLRACRSEGDSWCIITVDRSAIQ